MLILSPQIGQGQTKDAQPQGSRPGQTYHTGASANQQTPTANPSQAAPATSTDAQNAAPTSPASADNTLSPSSDQSAIPAGTLVIMEFSDLQCPDSARYNTDLKKTIMQRYVNNGKAVYQWHDFPLSVHPQAPEAAAAARCAGSSTDSMRQQIMANQGQMSDTIYAQYARQLGVDPAQFSACMRSDATKSEVMKDQALGQSMGVRGTPTLVLGTADGRGQIKPVKVVKAYDPPQQVMAEIDTFIASAQSNTTQQ